MNQEDPKPGVVIDVTPDADADVPREQPAEPPPTEPSRGRGSAFAVVVALAALVLAAAAAWLGYRHLGGLTADLEQMGERLRDAREQQDVLQRSVEQATRALREQQDQLGAQQDALTGQRDAMEQTRAAFQQQERLLAEEAQRLQVREAELRAAIVDVHERVGRSGHQWIIAEAGYLLRVANHRLILAGDRDSARVALEIADQRLRDTADPGWAGVRAQLALDIAALSTSDEPDLLGLSARIGALIDQVPQLRIAHTAVGPAGADPEPVATAPAARSWSTLLDDLWAGFKDAIRIRRRDAPVQAMLAPDQAFFMYENLRLRLEAVRLALLQGRSDLFAARVDDVAAWLDQYFDPADGRVQGLHAALAELRAARVEASRPDISGSLRAFQVRRQSMVGMATDSAVTR